MRIADFISQNWAMFEAFCEENGDDAGEILKSVSNED